MVCGEWCRRLSGFRTGLRGQLQSVSIMVGVTRLSDSDHLTRKIQHVATDIVDQVIGVDSTRGR